MPSWWNAVRHTGSASSRISQSCVASAWTISRCCWYEATEVLSREARQTAFLDASMPGYAYAQYNPMYLDLHRPWLAPGAADSWSFRQLCQDSCACKGHDGGKP